MSKKLRLFCQSLVNFSLVSFKEFTFRVVCRDFGFLILLNGAFFNLGPWFIFLHCGVPLVETVQKFQSVELSKW